MSKDWDSYRCEIDGKAASVFVDMGIAEDVPLERMPVAAWVQVAMVQAGADGMPEAEESGRLEAVEADHVGQSQQREFQEDKRRLAIADQLIEQPHGPVDPIDGHQNQ